MYPSRTRGLLPNFETDDKFKGQVRLTLKDEYPADEGADPSASVRW
jgi:hypothetical protein